MREAAKRADGTRSACEGKRGHWGHAAGTGKGAAGREAESGLERRDCEKAADHPLPGGRREPLPKSWSCPSTCREQEGPQEPGELGANTESSLPAPGTAGPRAAARELVPVQDLHHLPGPSSASQRGPLAPEPVEGRLQAAGCEDGTSVCAAPTTSCCPQLSSLPWLPVALRDRPQFWVGKKRLKECKSCPCQ